MAVEDFNEIDRLLFREAILRAIMAHRQATHCPLSEAIDAISARIEHLWADFPEQFTVPREGYGNGVLT